MSFRAVEDAMPRAILEVVPPEEDDIGADDYVEHLTRSRSNLAHDALGYLDGSELHGFFLNRQWEEDDIYQLGVMKTALSHPEADFGMALWFLIMVEANVFLTSGDRYSFPEYRDAVRSLIRHVIDRANSGLYRFVLYDTHTNSAMISNYCKDAPEACRLDATLIRAAHAHVKKVSEYEASKPESGLTFDELLSAFANRQMPL